MTAADVLDFWFLPATAPGHGRPRREWFAKDPAFDATIRERFAAEVEAALAGERDAWRRDEGDAARGGLALVILLDQFTRNLFRGKACAFAGDAQARVIAAEMVGAGDDRRLQPLERVFAYLPFEHSESLADQERSLALFGQLAAERADCAGFLDYAQRHHAVIARFGRFPHRNAALGRASTADETDYLAQPGSGF